jgi:hypothetical protein
VKNSSLTYAPVRSKVGRLSFDATFAKTVDAVWASTEWFWSFSIDVCNMFKNSTKNFLSYILPGIFGYIKDAFRPCPYEKV